MSKIFRVAKAKRSPAKAKRDAAMLSLLFDLKLPCQKIADLKLMDIKGILDGSFEGIFFTSSKDTERLRSVRCHPYTAKCIKEWVKVCETEFRWPYHVNTSPIYHCFAHLSLVGYGAGFCTIKLRRRDIKPKTDIPQTRCCFQGIHCSQDRCRCFYEQRNR